jgi:hypothetical protein
MLQRADASTVSAEGLLARRRARADGLCVSLVEKTGAIQEIAEARAFEAVFPFLKTEIYLRDTEPRLQTLTAFDRFSVRA